MKKRSIREVPLAGARLVIRTDYNGSDYRIRASIPTLRRVLEGGARAVLVAHLGRPRGTPSKDLSLRPVAARLEALLGHPVRFRDPGGDSTVTLLENVRFDSGEEEGSAQGPELMRRLRSMGEVFVLDGFGCAHRADHSLMAAREFPLAVTGLLLEREIEKLDAFVADPEPKLVVVGGSKVTDKVGALEPLASRLAAVLVGGRAAAAFLAAQGRSVGDAAIASEEIEAARRVLALAPRVVLPVDHVATLGGDPASPRQIVGEIPKGWAALDIGPASEALFEETVLASGARSLLWAGPLGLYERNPFEWGTETFARFLGSHPEIRTVVGGGNTAEAVESFGLLDRFWHVSTGGTAALEFLEGRSLPAIEVLTDDVGPNPRVTPPMP